MEVELIFKIAAIGIIVAVLNQLLIRSGREEQALMTSGLRQLPSLQKGELLSGLAVSLTQGKTSPPAPFNEATLLSAMENPAAYLESGNRELAKTLGETGGLGTVATRADIIEKLFSSFLLE